jgi:serine/threonine protein kinase
MNYLLGQGGYSQVYHGIDLRTGKELVIYLIGLVVSYQHYNIYILMVYS